MPNMINRTVKQAATCLTENAKEVAQLPVQNSKKFTKKQKLIQLLLARPLSTMEAIELIPATRPATLVHELRSFHGINIQTEMHYYQGNDGQSISYASYYLPEQEYERAKTLLER